MHASMIIQVENVTITTVKTIRRCNLSTEFLPQDTAWGSDGEKPWMLIDCGQAHLDLRSDHIIFAKVTESRKDRPAQSHLALIQAVSDNAVALLKIDRHIRSRDIKALADATQAIGDVDAPPFMTSTNCTNALDLFPQESIEWRQPPPHFDLSLTNLPFQEEGDTSLTNLSSNQIDPHKLIHERYIETLYSGRIPLVYFAKSTLPKTKLLFGSCNQKFIETLSSLLLTIECLDKKYSLLAQADTSQICRSDEDVVAWKQWLTTNLSSDENLTRQRAEELKMRETELQVTILLEILANSTAELNVKPAPEPMGKPRARLVRKKKTAPKTNEPIPVEASSLTPLLKPAVALDILFDRLCIHNAVQTPEPSDKAQPTKAFDSVRHFCFEIVLPFYSSKLPEKSRELVSKARGPSSGPRVVARPSASKLDIALKSIADEDSLQSTTLLTTSTDSASRKGSTRGALPVTGKDQQKRQVSFTVGSKRVKRDLSAELAQAIQTIAKPNRTAATRSEFHILAPPTKKPLPSSRQNKKPDPNIVQVEATPARKRTMQPARANISPVTPKRQRLNFVAETPSRMSPLKLVETPISKVPDTPSKQ